MASFSFLLLVLLHALMAFTTAFAYSEGVSMEDGELLGLFEVMGSLLADPTWAQVHPQPCTETPWPGVQCELMVQEDGGGGDDQQDYNPTIFHVTKIHIGTDVLTPPCKPTATLSPKALLKLPYLKTLSLFNCFTESPFFLSSSLFENNSLSSLEHLALVSNPSLHGSIPSSLGHIQGLKILSLSQNNLTGEIPDEICGLVNLQELDLSYNQITGSVPQEIGSLTSLTIFDLSYNMLQAQLPSSFGQLQSLQKIDLGSNDLTGRIPQELGNLSKLVLLDLSHNSLSGPLPESLAGLKMVEYLVIQDNPINTGMPLFIGSLGTLKVLSFSRCGLMGPILTSLSKLKNLTALSLDNNRLNGTVPSNIGSLQSLEQLNLSQNQLSGDLVVSDEFISRVGKRLDIIGNSGLCIKNTTSSSTEVKSPNSCVNARSRTGGNKSSWDEEEEEEDEDDSEECGDLNTSLHQRNRCSRNHDHHGYGLNQMFLLMAFFDILGFLV
ncbi:piriformospora indica-insensitive protein 2-like [Cynara cardunculus var. scolymus]|uniref:piriformospora indica-insensitive protein 2-like n=1 Tax=Cynara cardunculus var. scolymus TaxID=59895 RepID=UPI000D6284D7|nr:piriformospora indica-insensitive protein 2-like [Cynara cardunculus var. scolymus]